MTHQEFATALSRTRLQARAAGAARRVLVDGLSKSAAAREVGLSPEAGRQAVARIEREHKGVIGCPRGWSCLTVCVPEYSDEYFAIRESEKAAWRKEGLLAP